MGADRYLEVEGARLRYRDEGHGAPVVLIHGWTLDLDMWQPQVDALQDRLRLVRFDRRGFGLSGGAPDLDLDARDAQILCRHLNLDRVTFVGMSQGARVLEGLMIQSPDLVEGLVFDGAPDMRPGAPLTLSDVPVALYAEVVRLEGLPAFRELWKQNPLSRLLTPASRAHELLQSMLDRYPGVDLLQPEAASTAAAAWESVPPTRESVEAVAWAPVETLAWESVRVPALVLNGERDLDSRLRAGDLLAGRLPGALRARVPGAGHLPNLDNPAAYNRILHEFVEACRRSPDRTVGPQLI